MPYCIYCGNKINEGDRFCTKCGAKIDYNLSVSNGIDNTREANNLSNAHPKDNVNAVTTSNSKKKNKTFIIVLVFFLLLLGLVVLACYFAIHNNNVPPNHVATTDSVYIDSTSNDSEDVDISLTYRDSKVANFEELKEKYRQTVIYNSPEHQPEDIFSNYYLFDIDNDGVPELIIDRGTCEADRTMTIYTWDGSVCEIYKTGIDHSSYYGGHNYLLRMSAHMGGETITRYTKEDMTIYAKVVYAHDFTEEWEKAVERDSNAVCWYNEPKEPALQAYEFTDLKPINSIKLQK